MDFIEQLHALAKEESTRKPTHSRKAMQTKR